MTSLPILTRCTVYPPERQILLKILRKDWNEEDNTSSDDEEEDGMDDMEEEEDPETAAKKARLELEAYEDLD